MKKKCFRKLKILLLNMFKIGCIGFGGGSALIPVIEEEAVSEKKLVSEEEFYKDVIVANITPGALPVEIAAGIGRHVCGLPGMMLAALMIALPGTFLTVFIISLINQSSVQVLRQILFASAGVTAYIIFMLIEYARTTWQDCRRNYTAKESLFFMLLVFFLTSGKELFQIFQIDRVPIFDISTVDVLAITFFIIFYTNGERQPSKITASTVMAVLYALCVGKMHVISNPWIPWILRILMVILAVWGFLHGLNGKIPFSWKSLKRLIREEICWFFLCVAACIPAVCLFSKALPFIGRGLLSALVSFGGGDAYLAVANGLFVNTDMIGYEDFYSKVVSVANGLPGSILCKILAGVGYILGHNEGGILVGFVVAIAGFVCSVAASGGTFSAVAYIYERFENLEIFQIIRKYIRPIIAGLLLSVCASMVYQNMVIADKNGWSVCPMLCLTLFLCLMNAFWKFRGRMRPIFTVLLSAGVALGVCNLFLIAG